MLYRVRFKSNRPQSVIVAAWDRAGAIATASKAAGVEQSRVLSCVMNERRVPWPTKKKKKKK